MLVLPITQELIRIFRVEQLRDLIRQHVDPPAGLIDSINCMLASQSFLPYGRQTISEDDIAAVVEVLPSPILPRVQRYQLLNKQWQPNNARYGVAANSATSALHLVWL